MTVFIGIPSMNLVKYLTQTIDSIQTKYNWRLLLVDNDSRDGTRQWTIKSGYEYILNPINFGVARSWNQILRWGVSHDDCEAVIVTNNDIVLHKDAIDNMMETLLVVKKPAVTAVEIGMDPKLLEKVEFPPLEHRYTRAMHFSCFALTPETIEIAGYFDEKFKGAYFEDNDYHHRLMALDLDGVCDLWAQFTHYRSRTMVEGGGRNANFLENKEYFRQKWGFVP